MSRYVRIFSRWLTRCDHNRRRPGSVHSNDVAGSFGGNPWTVAVYMIGMALMSLGALYLAAETLQVDISEDK